MDDGYILISSRPTTFDTLETFDVISVDAAFRNTPPVKDSDRRADPRHVDIHTQMSGLYTPCLSVTPGHICGSNIFLVILKPLLVEEQKGETHKNLPP